MTLTIVSIAWTVYTVILAALVVFGIGFTRHYKSKHESEAFATVVTIVALSLMFATLTLLPMDIFLVSSTVDQHTGLKKDWATRDAVQSITHMVQVVSYVCYGLVALCNLVLIPFAYFYYEEYEDEQTRKERIMGAAKYTSFFIVISTLLFLCGLFLKPTQEPPRVDLDWFRKLLTDSNGEKAIAFIIACLVLLGMLVFIGYTAPGLSILPLTLIKGKRGIDAENEDVDNRLVTVHERRRVILAKYTGARRTMNARDQREFDNLEDEERILQRRLQGIQQDKSSLWFKITRVIRPFEILLGLVLLALTVILVLSIFLAIVDKISSSLCGSECGYIINHPKLFNPVNFIFVNLSKLFPLDYVFMAALILYFFMATLSGLVTIGVRFLWMTLFQIRKGSTMPQGLLVSTVLLTLSLLALNYVVTTTVAPGYAHFGSQVYCNHTVIGGRRDCSDQVDLIVPCDIDGPTEICTPTVTSSLIDRMIVNTPFFGLVFYYAQWAFLAIFAIGSVVTLCRRPRNNVDAESQDFVDAEEEQGLLNGQPTTYGTR